MYKHALHDSFNIRNAIGLLQYKVEFRREHPFWFDPIGTAIFIGSQGAGKTLSGVNYVYNVLKDYPYCLTHVICNLWKSPMNFVTVPNIL